MKKKIISVLSTFLCIIGMSAQVPGSFQYQAVLRNDDGSIASNKPLEVRVRIHQGAADGTVVYEEDHTTSSNASGIITLKVGEGVNTSRETLFVDVDWSDGVYFFETLVNRGAVFGISIVISGIPYTLKSCSCSYFLPPPSVKEAFSI